MSYIRGLLKVLGEDAGLRMLTTWASITVFLCFVPVICNLELNGGPSDPSMNSLNFKFSLVASIAISVPMVLDFLLSLASSYRDQIFMRGWTSKAVLLIALLIPDLVIFFVVIPSGNQALLVCLFAARLILCTYAVLSHLWDFGASVFKSHLTLWCAGLAMTAF
eukprot:gene57243-76437_t